MKLLYNKLGESIRGLSETRDILKDCDANGVKCVIEEQDRKLKKQNNGVMVKTEGGETYYGVLEEVVELKYPEEVSIQRR
ncbi:hypothetical protein QQ045_021753 [Rhodiola kirilowii]